MPCGLFSFFLLTNDRASWISICYTLMLLFLP
uniref:Uncharacterized protein n=1 Tax=Arundo donax TaxID=35708 RepID=A0A0A8YWE2_ARUDO